MVLGKNVEEYAAVQVWRRGLQEQWGSEPDNFQEQLVIVERFCEFVGRDPDAIIEECVREVEGGKRIRMKARRLYSEKIAEFQASLEGDSRRQGRCANAVRSFLIHNGIFLQSGIQT